MAEWWQQELEGAGENWWDAVSKTHGDWWQIEGEENTDKWWEMSGQGEEGEWLEGVRKSLPIFWYHIFDWIPVSDEKEIVQVKIEPKTKSHPEGGYFDGFSLKRSLMLEKLYGAEIIKIPVEATSDSLEIPVFGALSFNEIKAAHLLPEGSVAGDNTDYMILRLRNKQTGGDICTKTYIEGNDLQAYKVDHFGPPNPAHAYIDEDEGCSLIIEKVGAGFTLPRSLLIIQWDLS